jgi:hypothetical protein
VPVGLPYASPFRRQAPSRPMAWPSTTPGISVSAKSQNEIRRERVNQMAARAAPAMAP